MTTVTARPASHRLIPSVALADSAARADTQGCLSPRDFEVFVNDYADRLLLVARRYLCCEEDAADAVQDALLCAFRSLSTFQSRSTVYTWLYRIVVNRCLMKIRSRPRDMMVSFDEWLPTCDDGGCHRHPLMAGGERAEHSLERDELCAAVRAGIDSLPADYRTILLLRDIEQFDTGERPKCSTCLAPP